MSSTIVRDVLRKPIERGRGFSLIELLIVIAIVGTLSAIVLANFGPARAKGRNAERMSELIQLQFAIEQYYDDYGEYPKCGPIPPSGGKTGAFCPTFSEGTAAVGSGGVKPSPFEDLDIFPTYQSTVPEDPTIGDPAYQYVYVRGYRKTGPSTWVCITGTNANACGAGNSGSVAGDPKREYILFARLETYSGGPSSNTPFRVSIWQDFNVLLGNE